MKIRIRGPEGQATIELSETATVEDLHSRITEKTNIVNFTISYGYPHLKPLVLRDYAGPVKLSEIGINLDGEQLIVRETGPPSLQGKPRPSSPSPEVATTDGTLGSSTTLAQSSFSFAKVGTAPPAAQKPNTPLSLTDRSKSVSLDVPEVPLPTHASTLLLRIMPDDNSCLFRAFNTAFFGAIDNMHELRSIIAQNIQSNPDVYSAVVLEQNPDDYCVWIQSDDAWGGAIELGILSKHFDIEICSIDVQVRLLQLLGSSSYTPVSRQHI